MYDIGVCLDTREEWKDGKNKKKKGNYNVPDKIPQIEKWVCKILMHDNNH